MQKLLARLHAAEAEIDELRAHQLATAEELRLEQEQHATERAAMAAQIATLRIISRNPMGAP